MSKFLNSEIAQAEDQAVRAETVERLKLELHAAQTLLAQYAVQLLREQQQVEVLKLKLQQYEGANGRDHNS